MSRLLQSMFKSGQTATRSGQSIKLHSHLPLLECEIIQHWRQEHKSKNLVEIGLGFGVSTVALCESFKSGRPTSYHIFDPHQHSTRWQGIGLLNLERAGYADWITFHERPSELGLPRLIESAFRCDFAFIDGRHTFDQALVDFFLLNQLLSTGGIIIFDDVHLPAIAKAAGYVAQYPCYERLSLPAALARSKAIRLRTMAGSPPARVAGFIKTAPDERPSNWYVEF